MYTGDLAQALSARMLAAALEVQSALARLSHGPAADRCARALDQLDDAIKLVRQLALAARQLSGEVEERQAGSVPAPRGAGRTAGAP